MSTLSQFGGAGVAKWVSGTTYPLDAIVWSPTNYLAYVRIVAGGGTTDPSSDTTNWALFGPSKIRSVQRGTVQITTTNTTGTATLGTTLLNTAKAEVRILGTSCDVGTDLKTSDGFVRIALTNTTTITATRIASGTNNTATVSYEVTEWW